MNDTSSPENQKSSILEFKLFLFSGELQRIFYMGLSFSKNHATLNATKKYFQRFFHSQSPTVLSCFQRVSCVILPDKKFNVLSNTKI